jgi:A/G-specific adenine glycosylase
MPRKPLCEKCPFRQNCTAHLNIKTTAFPVKIKKNEKKRRCFHYLVLMSGADVLVRQRPKGDIWTALWEFPLVEAPSIDISPEALRIASPWLQQLPQATLTHSSKTYRQTLTHQQIAARFWVFEVDPNLPATKNKEWQRIPWKSLKEIALPGIIRSYLEDKNLSIHFQ